MIIFLGEGLSVLHAYMCVCMGGSEFQQLEQNHRTERPCVSVVSQVGYVRLSMSMCDC